MENQKLQLNGKALKMLRLSHDLKAIEAASKIGISKQHFSNCEQGRRTLSVNKTKEFIELIGSTESDVKTFIEMIGE